jgi:hypothetical protein
MDRRMDRVTQAERAANIARDLTDARNMLRSPSFYDTPNLRWACSILETYGDGGDYLLADQMIHALNLRERQDAHATVRRQFVDGYDPDRPKPADNGLRNVLALLCFAGLFGLCVGWVLQMGWQP